MKNIFIIIGMGLIFNSTGDAATKALDGQTIFNKNCSACHSVNPPPKLAPPITPLASRYHLSFKTKKDGVNHLAAYLKLPKKEDSIDPQAITRFGLMPPVALSAAELNVVAAWVWDQYNPAMGMGRGFGGQGRGPSNP
ncbi:MAG: cytochrome c [Chlorobium sp.]|nr:MAG: cytochrome c [Chlorobium sp.]